MIEKVNPSHPDKLADRIAGAIVDLAYKNAEDPRVAVEVMLGHGKCYIMIESSEAFNHEDIYDIVGRIAGVYKVEINQIRQDDILANNQKGKIRCGDNGIFKGVPLTTEEMELSLIAREIYKEFPTDGKYIKDKDKLIICQSNASYKKLAKMYPGAIINPLGYWTGGTDVDTGCTNRKIGSDMGHSITGGGLHGKDLSKADVSINIFAFKEAQRRGKTVEYSCAIGDEFIDGFPYSFIVGEAKRFIKSIGGFEKFAEWGLF